MMTECKRDRLKALLDTDRSADEQAPAPSWLDFVLSVERWDEFSVKTVTA